MNRDDNNLFPSDPAPSLDSSEQADLARQALPDDSPHPDIDHPAAPSKAFENFQSFNTTVPEDLRVPWGWTDIVLLAILAIAGLILISLFVGLALAMSGADRNLLLVADRGDLFRSSWI